MHFEKTNVEEFYLVRLNPKDDILTSLQHAAKKLNIKNGIIIGGVGSVNAYHFHVVSSMQNPPQEIYPKGEAPADIISMSGFILDGKVHAHISFSNDRVAYGGHLEEGSRVLTFSTIVLAKISNTIGGWDKIGDIEPILENTRLKN
ncbi:MAG: hypothetical protein FD137_784 [Spirochaetes bacterium]|nr:MAG: hypothetical protein FD137_784 [Spirochaetota bacterium]